MQLLFLVRQNVQQPLGKQSIQLLDLLLWGDAECVANTVEIPKVGVQRGLHREGQYAVMWSGPGAGPRCWSFGTRMVLSQANSKLMHLPSFGVID